MDRFLSRLAVISPAAVVSALKGIVLLLGLVNDDLSAVKDPALFTQETLSTLPFDSTFAASLSFYSTHWCC